MSPLGKLHDDTFKVPYRYEGLMREAAVEEVRLSSSVIYRLRGKHKVWDLEKKNGIWKQGHQKLTDEVFKQICLGIDAWLEKRGY